MSKLLWTLIEANKLSWQNFKHICIDSVPAMIGVKPGFATLVKNEWPPVTSLHCSLHRFTLASKALSVDLIEVMDVAVKVINFIGLRAKNHRLFQLLPKQMEVQHAGLLFYFKVRLLSRGKCLNQLYELKNEVEIFLRENKGNLYFQFHNESLLCCLRTWPMYSATSTI